LGLLTLRAETARFPYQPQDTVSAK